jgi:ribonucleotide reductase beta subunit family protein with ferritin-like domain
MNANVQEVTIHEAKAFFNMQIANETVHAETYSILLDLYSGTEERKQELLGYMQTMPSIKKKADWALAYTDPATVSFAKRLVAFCCVEGIHFSSSFGGIFFVKTLGVLPGSS